MKIVLDAMGSDDNPVPDVAGAVWAARELGVTVILVGDENKIKAALACKAALTGIRILGSGHIKKYNIDAMPAGPWPAGLNSQADQP